MSATESGIHEPEIVDERALARPTAAATVNDLALLDDEKGIEVIKQRLAILENLRAASIRLTFPNDWTLFRGPAGTTAFLADQGGDRVRKFWGISILNLGQMEKIEDSNHPEEFAYRISGDGHCALTGESVTGMEGIRYSTEGYANEKPEGLQRIIAVQKAARANLEGGIVRELTGLKSIPIEELDKCWEGTRWKSSMCNLGRGFGSGNERVGGAAAAHGVDYADIPVCTVCKDEPKLVFRKDGKPPFWGCLNYKIHPKDKVMVNHEELLARIAKRKAAPQEREPGAEG